MRDRNRTMELWMFGAAAAAGLSYLIASLTEGTVMRAANAAIIPLAAAAWLIAIAAAIRIVRAKSSRDEAGA